jgi:hypothetical protein
MAISEKQNEPVGDKRRVTTLGPKEGRLCHLQEWEREGEVMCGGQRDEESGREVVYVGCRHSVGEKNSGRDAGKGTDGCPERAESVQRALTPWRTHLENPVMKEQMRGYHDFIKLKQSSLFISELNPSRLPDDTIHISVFGGEDAGVMELDAVCQVVALLHHG